MFLNCVYLRITEVVVAIRDVPMYATRWIGYLRAHDLEVIKVNLKTLCSNKVNNLRRGCISLVESIRNFSIQDLNSLHEEVTRRWHALNVKIGQYATYAQTDGLRDVQNFCQTAYGYGLYIRTQLQRYLPNH